MGAKQNGRLRASCRCGAVAFDVTGPPIAHAACYCASCHAAGWLIGQRLGAPPVLDADGGTDFVLYRKDRVRCAQGGERLEGRRLWPESPTRRLMTSWWKSALGL